MESWQSLFVPPFPLSLRRLRVNVMSISFSVIVEGSSLELLFFLLLAFFGAAGMDSTDGVTSEGSVLTFSSGSFLVASLIIGAELEAAGFEAADPYAFSPGEVASNILAGCNFFLSGKPLSSLSIG